MHKATPWGWLVAGGLMLAIVALSLVAWRPELVLEGPRLRVLLEPADAIRAGAGWRVAGAWSQADMVALDVALGKDFRLEFKEIPGWISPQPVPLPQGRGEHVVQVQYQRQPLVPKTILRLHGSNTVGQNMAPEWAQRYLRHLGADDVRLVPGSDPVEKSVEGVFSNQGELWRIEIKAHGSSTAFKALQEGLADIGMSSRRVKDSERDTLLPLGDLMTPEHEYVVALDGIAVIVNRANALEKLTRKQVADIFAGRITNWKDLGLPPGPIVVHARDDKSGTFDTFKHLVLGNDVLTASAKRYESSSELSDAVAADPWSIGFCGLGYINKSKELAIQDEGVPIRPSPFSVSTEDYPLARRLYLYAPRHDPNSHVARFLAFVLGREGQDAVTKHGYVSLDIAAARTTKAPGSTAVSTAELQAPVSSPSASQPVAAPNDPLADIVFTNQAVGKVYREAVRDAERLAVNFRFEFGKFVLDSRAVRDVYRVAELVRANPGRQLVLVGFSDAVGEYERNLELSRRRADAVAEALRQRGVAVAAVVAAGEEAPVASNDDPVGRERNRRVEAWLR